MATDLSFVVWNMAHRVPNWAHVGGHRVALLVEAVLPPPEFLATHQIQGLWTTEGEKRRHWSTAIAWQMGAPVEVIHCTSSRAGTLTAAVYDSRVIIAACYATWEPDPDHPEWRSGRSDWSALALVEDLLSLQRQLAMPLVAAGDWNLWPSGYPNADGCSIIAPVEEGLQRHGVCRVPLEGEPIHEDRRSSTYGTLPASAIPTYDHVFASEELMVRAEAKNSAACWGPSDHCQIEVTVSTALDHPA